MATNIIENPSPEFERQFVLAINARRKLKGNKPKFVVTSDQVLSSNNDDNNSTQNQVILTVKSLQLLLLSCIDKSPRAYSDSWCKILRVQKLEQILVVVVNGITDENYQQLKHTDEFQEWKQLFTSDNICHQFRFHTQTNIPFLEQFSQIAAKSKSTNPSKDNSLLKTKAIQLSKKKRSLEDQDERIEKFQKTYEDQFSRTKLILSLKQLITGNYPCPIYNPFKHFQQIKSSYQPVSSTSRIFALDVETFSDLIHNRQIPYWISVVDEQLNCVYQVLIKPDDEQHFDAYQQRRNQVMESIVDIREVTLEQVQKDLGDLFDENSILAGHSIENDLKYLQIYYPYIIDTSIIYNITGSRIEKSSLQKLYAVFFGRLIQKIRLEHDPTEDARATMELILLKLSKNIEFGDWFLGGVDQLKILGHFDTIQLNENIEECQTFLSQTKFGLQEDFFKKIKQQNKCLIIEQQRDSDKPISLSTVHVDSNRQVYKKCLENLVEHDLLWLQFYSDIDNHQISLKKINKYMKNIYENLREDSIVIGIFSGNDRFSQCFIRIKDQEKFNPLIIDGKEYPYDLKLNHKKTF